MSKYLVQALRAYRDVTEGQFGQQTSTVLPLTQDAAEEIERLQKRVTELEEGVIVSLDGKRQLFGMTSGLDWKTVAQLVHDYKHENRPIVTLVATPDGLKYIVD